MPDSKTLLLAYSHSSQLYALMFIGEPPALHAQLLPVDLPELAIDGASEAGHPFLTSGRSLLIVNMSGPLSRDEQ